jgi:hypothetical protein
MSSYGLQERQFAEVMVAESLLVGWEVLFPGQPTEDLVL